MDIKLVNEFQLDWHLEGKSKQTAKNYAFDLRRFIQVLTFGHFRQCAYCLNSVLSSLARRIMYAHQYSERIFNPYLKMDLETDDIDSVSLKRNIDAEFK